MTFPPPGAPDRPVPDGNVIERRRGGVLFPTLVILAILAIAFIGFTGFYTDLLWYQSVGFSSVFTTQLWTRLGLFLVFGLVLAVIVALNAYIAYRLRPVFRGLSPEQQNLDRYRVALDPYKRLILLGGAGIILLLGGASAAAEWRTFLQWRNGVDFGVLDPQFARDISFFAFDLPWFRYLIGFGFAVVVLSAAAALVVHYLYGGLKLQTPGEKFTPAATAHLSVLAGLFMLLKAVAYYFDRFQLAVTDNARFTGLNFTQVNAVLPAKNILLVIALITAALFFVNIFRRTWSIPIAAVGLLVLSAVIIGSLYPSFVQRFQVRPSEANKEEPFIQRNIDSTRDAYDLADTEKTDYAARQTTTAAAIAEDRGTIRNVRLLDPTVVPPTFNQLQQIRGFYSFADSLDVDRYTVDDEVRDSVVAVREVNLAGLPASNRNWINDHTVFTHGFGFVSAFGNTADSDGRPSFFASDIPPTGDIDVEEPRIYFGESSPSYSIVGAPEGTAPRELDFPDDASPNGQANNTYAGEGGVEVGSLFRKVLFAVKYQEGNILLSNLVNSESKILYDRTPRTRVQKVAPWLTLDGNAYPAVVDGRVVWILDAYTTTNGYPYSARTVLGEATSDSITAQSQFVAAQLRDEVNYIRNSVKATVDAYDGTVTLYEWDTEDPVLKTWSNAFPGTVQPREALDGELLEHVRYPEDLFKVQRELYSRYHVTDALAFYSGQDFWAIPDDPTTRSGQAQPPYYLTIQMPGTDAPAFSLTSTFSPQNRQTLAAFMAVNAEPGEDYGKIRVLQLPRNTTIPGPVQVQNNIESDPTIAQQLSLLRRGGSEVEVGNLLTLPVGGGLLYVEPIYVRAAASTDSFPLLRKVAVAFGNRTAMEDTLDEALTSVFQGQIETGTDPTPGGDGGDGGDGETGGGEDGGGTPPTPEQTLEEAIDQASAAFERGEAALRNGDLAGYAAAQAELGAALARINEIRGVNNDPEDLEAAEG